MVPPSEFRNVDYINSLRRRVTKFNMNMNERYFIKKPPIVLYVPVMLQEYY